MNKRIILNNMIVTSANHLRIYLNNWENYPELEENANYIKTLISEYANNIYKEEYNKILEYEIIYSHLIFDYINNFVIEYCKNHNIEFTIINNYIVIDNHIINPTIGIGNVYHELIKLNRINKFKSIFKLVRN